MKKYLIGIVLLMNSVAGYSTVYTVNALGDANAGAGTVGDLRYCVSQASNVAGIHTINFNLPTAPYIITLNSPLNLYGAGTSVTIDATTQPGWVGNPLVVVRGNGGVSDGIQFNNGGAHQVKGIAFQNFTLNGILINTGNNNIIENCYFGIGTDGVTTAGNAITEYGILVRGSSTGNRIGNTPNATATRNVISNSLKGGIRVEVNCNNNSVQGNYIGTNATGTSAIPNGTEDQNHAGIYVLDANNLTVKNNIISGNKGCGIRIENGNSFNSVITGNYIGTDIAGTSAISNTAGGIRIEGSNNHTIGGSTVADRNLISANGGAPHGNGTFQYDRTLQCGVYFNNVNNSTISGNYIGIDISGVAAPFAIGNLYSGIKMEGNSSGNTIGGANASFRNIIGGNGYKESTVGVPGYRGHGIQLNGSNVTNITVTANYIGIGSDGTSTIGNRQDGVSLLGARNITVGGNNANLRNVIGDNCWGIFIQSNFSGGQSSGNLIIGNYIGTDATGTIARGNGTRGVDTDEGAGVGIQHGSNANYIGRDNAGEGNVISGNKAGIVFRSSGFGTANANFIYNNTIGLDASGNALQNAGSGTTNPTYYGNGVTIGGGCFGNIVGGTGALQRNFISGNALNGVFIEIGTTNIVRGNYIGTDITGASSKANGAAGVSILNVAGTVATQTIIDANVISGNSNNGMYLNASAQIVITGNTIGLNAAGTASVPNAGYGMWITNGSDNNTIGGSSAATTRNIIAAHSSHGINIDNNSNTNLIYGNYIGLGSNGITPFGNGGNGISISASSGTVVGGVAAGQGNVISNNGFTAVTASGVSFSGGSNNTSVIGNIIGLTSNGITSAGNSDYGIWGSGNAAGPTTIKLNITSANGAGTTSGSGIFLGDCPNSTVKGNVSGLNAAFAVAPNQLDGLVIMGTTVAVIGGTAAADRNILSGNAHYGLQIQSSSNNIVQGNSVGTDAAGTAVLGNGMGGIFIISASASNIIGGVNANEPNKVAYNTGNGIIVDGTGTVNNSIHQNNIYCNSLRGIVLSAGGNNGYAAPVITPSGTNLTATATAGSFIEVFTLDGCNDCSASTTSNKLQGKTLAFSGVSPFTFTPVAGTTYTATASVANTTAAHNTSEFSTCYVLCIAAIAPTSITISSGKSVCSDLAGNITMTANGGTTSDPVEWYTGSCLGTLAFTGNPYVITVPAVGVNKYYVRRTNGCGNSTCYLDSITVHTAPVAPTSASAGTPSFCSGTAGPPVTLNATGGSGENLIWYKTTCGTGTVVTSPVAIPSSTTNYFVRWESAACTPSNCAQATITIVPSPSVSLPASSSVCQDSIRAFNAGAPTADTYNWVFTTSGTGTITSGQGTNSVNINAGSANGTLTLTQTNAASCSTVVAVPVSIQTPGGTTALAGSDKNICAASLQLAANNTAGTWSVYAGTGTFSPDAFTYNASVSGLSNGLNKFIWTTTGTCGFVSKDTVALKVGTSGLVAKASTSPDTACFGSPKDIGVLVTGTGSGNYTYLWTSSDNSFNLSTSTANVTVNPVSTTTVYHLNIVDNVNTGCNSGDSVKVFALAAQQLIVPNLVTPNGDDKNDYLDIKDENNMKILPGSSIEIVNRWGERVYKHSSYDNSWNAPNLSDGVYYYYINSGCGNRVYKGWIQIIH